MFNQRPKELGTWVLIIGGILLVFDLLTVHSFTLFLLLAATGLTYIGWKNRHKSLGKLCGGVAGITLLVTAFSFILFRAICIILIVLFIYEHFRSKKEKTYMEPEIIIPKDSEQAVIRLDPLFKSRLFGDLKTPDRPFPWRDINIYSIYGDKVINLSNTVLLDDVAVISINQVIGNIEILVPYDVELSVHHSTLYGNAHIFGEHHDRLINQTLLYQTSRYREKGPRVKIVTSLLAGNIEVKRI